MPPERFVNFCKKINKFLLNILFMAFVWSDNTLYSEREIPGINIRESGVETHNNNAEGSAITVVYSISRATQKTVKNMYIIL